MAQACYDLTGKRIWVAGHRGMVGSAIVRHLEGIHATVLTASRDTLDLTEQQAVRDWMAMHKPEVVIVAAAKVGGIFANDSYPADFLYENLMIEANIIHSAFKTKVEKLLFLGSSCIYPKLATQPMAEDALLTGPLEPTNEWYAIAKIAGIKLCQAYRRQHGVDYISAMPTNLYGPGDNYNLQKSHVIPALLRKMHEAKERQDSSVEIWGTGKPKREFLHVDDMAAACAFLLGNYSGHEHINVGCGQDLSIRELAIMVARAVGYEGRLVFDPSKPDGTPRKLMDSTRLLQMGWAPKISLDDGLADTYRWFSEHRLADARL